MRFGLQPGLNRVDPGPVPGKFVITSFVHVDFRGAAQAGKCNHDAADFLLRVPLGAAKHVVDQGDSIVTAPAVGLGQLECHLQKTVGALCPTGPNRGGKASFEPFLHTLLIRCNAHHCYSHTSDHPITIER